MKETPANSPSSTATYASPQQTDNDIPPPRELHDVGPPPGGVWATRFRLDSLMLTIGLVAVCLAVARQSLVAGGILFLFSAPALVRTAFMAARRAANHDTMPALEKIVSFFGAFLAAAASGAMTMTVFFAMLCATLAFSVAIAALAGGSSMLTVLCVLLGMLATLGITMFFAACLAREFWQFDGARPGRSAFWPIRPIRGRFWANAAVRDRDP